MAYRWRALACFEKDLDEEWERRSSKQKKRSAKENNLKNAAIAETALHKGCVLITCDSDLVTVAKKHSIDTIFLKIQRGWRKCFHSDPLGFVRDEFLTVSRPGRFGCCPNNSAQRPHLFLSLPSAWRIESEEFQVFLASFIQGSTVDNCGTSKPRFVPAPSHYGMAKIAERYYIVRNVRAALCTRLYMMCVKNAVRIAVSITADLTLLAVALLHKSSEMLPMRRGVVGWHLFPKYITAELNAVDHFSDAQCFTNALVGCVLVSGSACIFHFVASVRGVVQEFLGSVPIELRSNIAPGGSGIRYAGSKHPIE